MNPIDPFQPTPPRPISVPPPRNGDDGTRDATADVARSQIDQIFGADGKPNATLSHSNQPMIKRDQVMPIDRQGSAPQPETIQSLSPAIAEEPAKSEPPLIADNNGEIDKTNQAHHQYHSAWQQYYQNYYSKYYISAMEKQRQNFVHQQASIRDSQQPDGTLTQKEAIDDLRSDLMKKLSHGAKKVRGSRHFVPAIAAVFVILLAAFVQYNGLLFAQVSAFVSPGSSTSQDIIIGTGANQEVGSDPRLIIPKINVNAPVIYGLEDLGEESSQEALRDGVIHYPIAGASALPGQRGNTVLLGHSSSDFFKPGNYKFIFVQLNRLVSGDLFYLDYQSKRFTYRVSRTEIISPNEVGKLAIGESKPYATLITCDPPGTALKRLVIYAEQISPDPSNSVEAQDTEDPAGTMNETIVGNPPTLFEQIFGS